MMKNKISLLMFTTMAGAFTLTSCNQAPEESPVVDKVADKATEMADKATDKAAEMADKATEMADKAVDKVKMPEKSEPAAAEAPAKVTDAIASRLAGKLIKVDGDVTADASIKEGVDYYVFYHSASW